MKKVVLCIMLMVGLCICFIPNRLNDALFGGDTVYAATTDEGTKQEADNDVDVGDYDGKYYYNDYMLLKNANNENTDLIKLCILLSEEAYSGEMDASSYGRMGYSCSSYNYGREATYEDNDFVAFNIGYKKVGQYSLFILTVRGTPDSPEWFSDFNLGEGDTHEGFRLASEELLSELETYFKIYASPTFGNNRILVTGHSRGAAVANIVAAQLPKRFSSYFSEENVFGYTFACPAVSKNADKSLKNIHNYNIPGDKIPAMPLSSWGFERNGQDHILDAYGDVYDNFLYQFKNKYDYNHELDYMGSTTTADFTLLMEQIAPTQEDYNNNLFIFKTLAAVLADSGRGDLWEYELKIIKELNLFDTLNDSIFENFMNAVTNGLYSTVETGVQVTEMVTHFVESYNEDYYMISDLKSEASMIPSKYYKDKAEYEKDHDDTLSFSQWRLQDKNNHESDIISDVESIIKMSIDSVEEMQQANMILGDVLSALKKMEISVEKIGELISTILKAPQNVAFGAVSYCEGFITGIGHAHDPKTYRIWIDSQYYGYEGWLESPYVPQILSIPTTITRIGEGCFKKCSKLKEIVIPDSVIHVGKYCFDECGEIKSITMPIDRIDDCTFHSANPLELHFTPGKTGIMPDYTTGSNMFPTEYTSLATVEFDEGITKIGSGRFNECIGLKKVEFPDGLLRIGNGAFSGCSSLESIVLPDSIKELGNGAFRECGNLNNIYLPDDLEIIGDLCFFGDDQLQIDPYLPLSLKVLGGSAFEGCVKLSDKIIIPDGIDEVYPSAFDGVPIKEISLSGGVFHDFFYDWEDPYSSPVETVIITKGKDGIVQEGERVLPIYQGCREDVKIVVSEGITELATYSFYGITCSEIHFPSTLVKVGEGALNFFHGQEELILPDGVVSIGDYAFSECGFKSIKLPESVIEIGVGAFMWAQITEMTLPSGIRTVNDDLFYECNNLTSVTIQSGVKTIGERAFMKCSMKSIVLPDGVEVIGNDAFNMESLEIITIPSSVNSIDMENYGTFGNATIKCYKDTKAFQYAKEWGLTIDLLENPIQGWLERNGEWYYYNSSGTMCSGWLSYKGKWYYLDPSSSAMVTGWNKIKNKWYCFKSNGCMAANEWCKGYWLNKDGTWTYQAKASWKKDVNGWWYGDSKGWYAKKQWQKIDDKWYYFDTKGYIVTGTKTIGGKTYRFNSNGVCLNP